MSAPLVVWIDPPTKQVHPLKYAPLVEALHERPGEWALLQRNPKFGPLQSVRNSLNRTPGYAKLAFPYELQVSVRRTEDGEDYGLWARLVEPA